MKNTEKNYKKKIEKLRGKKGRRRSTNLRFERKER